MHLMWKNVWLLVGFLLLSGRLIPSARRERKSREGMVSPVKDAPREEQADKNRRPAMLVLAVTLHNLPEGMAVGVALAGAMTENTGITMAAAMMLSMGIAIQNLPEGAIISMPLRNAGDSRLKAFRNGVLSGAVEPAGAFITVLLAEQVVPVLPYLLAFAAGAGLRRGDAVCSGGRTDSRSRRGRKRENRYHGDGRGFCVDDGPGCSNVTTHTKKDNIRRKKDASANYTAW